MTTAVKFTIGAVILGGITFVAIKAMNLAKKFDFEIAGFGMPKVSNWILSLPIRLLFKNPTSIAIKVDSVHADIYLWKVNKFDFVAQVDQPFTIGGGISESVITPNIDLKKLFSGNFFGAAQSILSMKKVRVRVDVSISYSGIKLPTQSIEQDVDISSYLQ